MNRAPVDDGPERHFEPKDAINETIKGTGIGAFAGVTVSAIKTTLTKHNVGAMAVFTRHGATIGIFSSAAAAYAFTSVAAANLRRREDSYNQAIGGFFAGASMGLWCRSLPAVLGFGAGTAVLLATMDYGGGLVGGEPEDAEMDKVARKEMMKKDRRRPMEETIAQIGEGRGIYPPGYEDRRRERLKEKYGLDIKSRLNSESSSP